MVLSKIQYPIYRMEQMVASKMGQVQVRMKQLVSMKCTVSVHTTPHALGQNNDLMGIHAMWRDHRGSNGCSDPRTFLFTEKVGHIRGLKDNAAQLPH